MAITINGSTNTLTGVAVGGLPDGIVDTDMLAANAVATGKIADNAVATGKIADDAVTAAKRGTGAILQIVSANKSDTSSFNISSYTDTGLAVTITPTSTSSKILVMLIFNATTNINTQGHYALERGGSLLGIGDANGSRVRCSTMVHHIDNDNSSQSMSIIYLDSPNTTSAITYKLQGRNDGSGTLYLNRSKNWGNGPECGACHSTATAMEIAG